MMSSVSSDALPPMHQTPFVQNFRPRVERSVPMSLYMRAVADNRPGSIAWTTPENALGSVSLSHSLSKSMSGFSDDTASFTSSGIKLNPFVPMMAQIPASSMVGEKRNIFKVKRVSEDHFTFTQGSVVLDPGAGAIRDRDTVLSAASKLARLFPEKLPETVAMGNAVHPGAPP